MPKEKTWVIWVCGCDDGDAWANNHEVRTCKLCGEEIRKLEVTSSERLAEVAEDRAVAAEAKLAAFEQALKSDAARAAVLAAVGGHGDFGPERASAAIDALLQAAHNELKESE